MRGAENVVSEHCARATCVWSSISREAHAGANIMALGSDEVVAPLGVEVLQIEPGTVTVSLERAGQLDVVVRPTVEGRPAPGYVVPVDQPSSRAR